MRKGRLQRGLTVAELMIVLAVGAAIAAGALAVYFFGAIPENPGTPVERLLVARIGPYNSKYKGWGYSCPVSGALSVIVNVGDTGDANQRFQRFQQHSPEQQGNLALHSC